MSNKGETAEDQFQGTISKFPPPKKRSRCLFTFSIKRKKLGIFTSSLWKNGKEMYKKIVIHVQNCCLAYETYRYQTFSLPSRRWILKTL